MISTATRLPPKDCELFGGGHLTFWIPALRTANDPEVIALTVAAEILDVHDEVLTLRLPSGMERFRHHNPWHLRACVRKAGSEIEFNARYRVLRWPALPGPVLNLAPDTGQPLEPCWSLKDNWDS